MQKLKTAGWLALVAVILGACGSEDESEPAGGDESDAGVEPDSGLGAGWSALDYSDKTLWLCGPNAAKDHCLEVDLTTSEAAADGKFETVVPKVATNPKLDCFYVYPTVDGRKTAENMEDVRDAEPVLVAMRNQVAHFSGVCRIIAPLYRQMTIGTYNQPSGYFGSEPFERAYADVQDAFDYYMENLNKGRPFVLMGHSQGTHMLIPLIAGRIENDPTLLDKLELALLIGPVGSIHVPEGKGVGGSFKKLPLCAKGGASKCIVAFDSKGGGLAYDKFPTRPIPEGMERACVVPSTLGASAGGAFAWSIWEKESGIPFPAEATKPWVSYPGATSGECEDDGMLGLSAVAAAVASVPFTPQAIQGALEGRGQDNALHIVDYNYAMGDLVRLVGERSDAL